VRASAPALLPRPCAGLHPTAHTHTHTHTHTQPLPVGHAPLRYRADMLQRGSRGPPQNAITQQTRDAGQQAAGGAPPQDSGARTFAPFFRYRHPMHALGFPFRALHMVFPDSPCADAAGPQPGPAAPAPAAAPSFHRTVAFPMIPLQSISYPPCSVLPSPPPDSVWCGWSPPPHGPTFSQPLAHLLAIRAPPPLATPLAAICTTRSAEVHCNNSNSELGCAR
jgi:hypothetical protein